MLKENLPKHKEKKKFSSAIQIIKTITHFPDSNNKNNHQHHNFFFVRQQIPYIYYNQKIHHINFIMLVATILSLPSFPKP